MWTVESYFFVGRLFRAIFGSWNRSPPSDQPFNQHPSLVLLPFFVAPPFFILREKSLPLDWSPRLTPAVGSSSLVGDLALQLGLLFFGSRNRPPTVGSGLPINSSRRIFSPSFVDFCSLSRASGFGRNNNVRLAPTVPERRFPISDFLIF